MRIQLFISEHAPEGHRLQSVLQGAMTDATVTRHGSPGDVVPDVQAVCNRRNIAVVMVAGNEELIELARQRNIWDRFWTILVLPESDPGIISLGHALRPRFMTFTDSDFTDVVEVLKYIQESMRQNACVFSWI